MFWLLTACLFVLAISFVLLPLWSRRRSQSFESDTLRESQNIALFHERSNELESELAAGNLDQEQFDGLILELQQSLLADVSAGGGGDELKTAASTQAKKGSKTQKNSIEAGRGKLWGSAVPVALALLMPVFSYTLYSQWGFIEDVELMGLYERTVNNIDDTEEAESLIISLGQVVQEDQDKPWAWFFLGENFASLGGYAEAEISYTQAAARLEETPEKAYVLGRVAMMKYFLADFSITDENQQVIDQARAINPGEVSTLQILAADANERQDYNAAIEYWRLLIQGNPNSAEAQLLRERIAEVQLMLPSEGQEIDAGPEIDVNIALADGIELDENLRVFVAARNAAREGLPPLAADFVTVGDLPATIRLDNSSAVGPFNLSSADTIYVSALISLSNSANAGSGDYQELSDNFAPNGEHAVIDLLISERLP